MNCTISTCLGISDSSISSCEPALWLTLLSYVACTETLWNLHCWHCFTKKLEHTYIANIELGPELKIFLLLKKLPIFEIIFASVGCHMKICLSLQPSSGQIRTQNPNFLGAYINIKYIKGEHWRDPPFLMMLMSLEYKWAQFTNDQVYKVFKYVGRTLKISDLWICEHSLLTPHIGIFELFQYYWTFGS